MGIASRYIFILWMWAKMSHCLYTTRQALKKIYGYPQKTLPGTPVIKYRIIIIRASSLSIKAPARFSPVDCANYKVFSTVCMLGVAFNPVFTTFSEALHKQYSPLSFWGIMRLWDVLYCRWHNVTLYVISWPPAAVCICNTPSGKIPLFAASPLYTISLIITYNKIHSNSVHVAISVYCCGRLWL